MSLQTSRKPALQTDVMAPQTSRQPLAHLNSFTAASSCKQSSSVKYLPTLGLNGPTQSKITVSSSSFVSPPVVPSSVAELKPQVSTHCRPRSHLPVGDQAAAPSSRRARMLKGTTKSKVAQKRGGCPDVEADDRRLRSNEQERTRQKVITQAFEKLLQTLPVNHDTTHKVGSKIYALECATAYIRGLSRLLRTSHRHSQVQAITPLSERDTNVRQPKPSSHITSWCQLATRCPRLEASPLDRGPRVAQGPHFSPAPLSFIESYTTVFQTKYSASCQEFSNEQPRKSSSFQSPKMEMCQRDERNLPYISHEPNLRPCRDDTFSQRSQPSRTGTQQPYWTNQSCTCQQFGDSEVHISPILWANLSADNPKTPTLSANLSADKRDGSLQNDHSTLTESRSAEATCSGNETGSAHLYQSSYTPTSCHHAGKECSNNDSGYFSCAGPGCCMSYACCSLDKCATTARSYVLEHSEKNTFSPERVSKTLHQLISGPRGTTANKQRQTGPPRRLHFDTVSDDVVSVPLAPVFPRLN